MNNGLVVFVLRSYVIGAYYDYKIQVSHSRLSLCVVFK